MGSTPSKLPTFKAETQNSAQEDDLSKSGKVVLTIYDRLDAWTKENLQMDADVSLHIVVDQYHASLLVDPELERFFDGHDYDKLRQHQFMFMKAIMNNAIKDFTNLERVHTNLFKIGLGGKEFGLVLGHLAHALNTLRIPEDIVTDILNAVRPLRAIFVAGAEKYGQYNPNNVTK